MRCLFILLLFISLPLKAEIEIWCFVEKMESWKIETGSKKYSNSETYFKFIITEDTITTDSYIFSSDKNITELKRDKNYEDEITYFASSTYEGIKNVYEIHHTVRINRHTGKSSIIKQSKGGLDLDSDGTSKIKPFELNLSIEYHANCSTGKPKLLF